MHNEAQLLRERGSQTSKLKSCIYLCTNALLMLLEIAVFECTSNILPTVGQLIRISYGTVTTINKFQL